MKYRYFENKKALAEISRDFTSDSESNQMVASEYEAIDFDSVKTKYLNDLHCSEEKAKSVDALLELNDRWFFIEFKNGDFNSKEILMKTKDSILIFCDITNKHIDFTREKATLVLVYNERKKGFSWKARRAVYLAKKGNVTAELPLRDIYDLEGYCIKNFLPIEKDEFDKWFTKLTQKQC